VISYYESHKPLADELENCRQIVMTSDTPWDPYDPVFKAQEQAAIREDAVQFYVGPVKSPVK